MTKKEFITRFRGLCEKYNISHIHCDDEDRLIFGNISFVNSQAGEIWSDYASEIGFNENGFYIAFNGTNCLVYEEDLCDTYGDNWDTLWDMIADAYDMSYSDEDIDGEDQDHDFKAGDAVYWNDPAIDDYPEEEREEALKRRFVIFDISGEIISISDTYTTAEVYADELEHIS